MSGCSVVKLVIQSFSYFSIASLSCFCICVAFMYFAALELMLLGSLVGSVSFHSRCVYMGGAL